MPVNQTGRRGTTRPSGNQHLVSEVGPSPLARGQPGDNGDPRQSPPHHNQVGEAAGVNIGAPPPPPCPVCGRKFPKLAGMRQHHRLAHPESFHRQGVERVAGSRSQMWSDEEIRMMAQYETAHRCEKFINQAIQRDLFPMRSIDSIKGKRRHQNYKAMLEVSELLSEEFGIPEDDLPNVTNSPSTPSHNVERPQSPTTTTTIVPETVSSPPHTLEDFRAEAIAMTNRLFPTSTRQVIRSNIMTPNYDIAERLPPSIARRRRFAATQRKYRRDRGQTIRDLLAGKDPTSSPQYPPNTRAFWISLFQRPSPPCDIPECPGGDIDILEPITRAELDFMVRSLKKDTAPGPDGITVAAVKSADRSQLLNLYNLLLRQRDTLDEWQEGRTVLLAKVDNPSDPGDYRPITITSILARGLHKILARRLASRLPTEPRQKGFKAEDGVSSNILLLRSLMNEAKTGPKTLYLAFIDFKKAFDSVGHEALLQAVKSEGLSRDSAEYLAKVYSKISTSVLGERTSINRGVMQGDPLSPHLFNLTLQHALKNLPPEVGVSLVGERISYLAFADDIVLVAESRTGLQRSVDSLVTSAEKVGLSVGMNKCATMGIIPNPGKRTWLADHRPFVSGESQLPVILPGGFYKYLGTEAGVVLRETTGRMVGKLRDQLLLLRRSCLKPQQKLWALKQVLIPKYVLVASHAEVKKFHLRKMDLLVREEARRFLHLPRDTPTGAFHAKVKEGGLGLGSLVTDAPKMTERRLLRLAKSRDQAVSYLAMTTVTTRQLPKPDPHKGKYWANTLHTSVDGCGLREAHLTPVSSSWVMAGTRMQSGATFLQSLKLRLGILPTPARSARGRDTLPNCDLGCASPGSMHHIQQVCPRVQPWRIIRHNKVANYAAITMKNKGMQVMAEPHIATPAGLRKPDLVAWNREGSYVIDVQVTSDSNACGLAEAHRRKVEKYNTDAVKTYVEGVTGRTPVVSSITINWRGIIAQQSLRLLRTLGFSNYNICLMIVRVVEGGISIYANYMGTSGGGDVT